MGSIEWMNTGEMACKRLGTECAEMESQNKDNLLLRCFHKGAEH